MNNIANDIKLIFLMTNILIGPHNILKIKKQILQI